MILKTIKQKKTSKLVDEFGHVFDYPKNVRGYQIQTKMLY